MRQMSTRRFITLCIASALVFVVAGCSKKEASGEAPKTVATAQTSQAGAPTAAAASATAMITAVDLGRAVGPDQRISDPDSSFAPTDTVHVVVQTNTSDGTSTAPVALAVRFVGPGDKVAHEESRNESFGGPGIADFMLHDSKGLVPGRYRVEVRLNGGEAQNREFDVH